MYPRKEDDMENYQQTPEQIIDHLKSNPDTGLGKTDVQKRLAQYGSNELVERGKKNPWTIFFAQFNCLAVIIGLYSAIEINNRSARFIIDCI